MADEVAIAIRLRNAQKFARDAAASAKSIRNIKDETGAAGRAAKAMGGAFSSASNVANRALGAVASSAKYLAFSVGLIGAAGVKMGLSFNAQIESARLRFGLFTNDVDGLVAAVSKIDMTSAFSLGDLSDAAALFGNAGIKDIPNTLQAAANAAAASGKGAPALNSIATALSQIASKGKLSQEEINQLNEAGAPGAQAIIAKHFQLTAKQLSNLGGEGLDATEAIKALTDEWTSGKMAKAAEAQTKTLGGQWNLLTGNVQKLSGAATESLATGLREKYLPAVNDAVNEITRIFGQEGLSNEQKLAQARNVIRREIGPVWEEIKGDIDEADIPGKLGDAVAAATPRVLDAMADIAPKAAKAFVDGWLASGPEAQVITALFLGNKLRKSDLGKSLFGGAGGGKGSSVANALGGVRGASPKNPVWVAMIGGGGPNGVPVPGGGGGGGGRSTARRVAGGAVATVAAVAGYDLLHGIAMNSPLARYSGRDGWGNLASDFSAVVPNGNNPSGAGRGAPVGNGSVPAPGFGNSGGIQQTNLMIDGRKIASAFTPYTQMEAARGNAAAAARK